MSDEKAKIGDVARAVGVSIMTVSRAIRGIEGVSPGRREEILRVARQLGYRPNRNAISLAAAHSDLIAISLPTFHNEVFAEILEGMRRTFDRAGFDTLLDVSDYDLDREASWVERMIDWRVAGIILSGTDHAPGVAERLRRAAIPTLELWDHTADPIDVGVGIDHEEAGRMLGRHLVAIGYERAVYIGVAAGHDPRAEKRLAGLACVFREAGLPTVGIERVDRHASFEAGKAGTIAVLDRAGTRPDVLCYLNDNMAFGGFETCAARGLAVPEDIGIAGFNGLGINEVLAKRLTTVVTPRREMGSAGAQALLARIRGVASRRRTALATILRPGETTRRGAELVPADAGGRGVNET